MSAGSIAGAAPASGFRRRLSHAAIPVVFAIFALVLCSPIIEGRVPVASNTLALWPPFSQLPHTPITNSAIADSALQYLPWNVFERNAISIGQWPFWDPYSFSGTSFAANSQSQLYYPLTWLLWLLPLSASIQLLALFNLWWAGMGMYLLCRHFGVSRPAALLGALSFEGSGILQLAIDATKMATPYGWLPWMLLTMDQALEKRSARWVALAALTCGLQLVSGNLQWCLYSYFLLVVWTVWRGATSLSRSGWSATVRTIAYGIIALAGGVALAVVHLAPALELAGLSTRATAKISSHSAPAYELLRLIMPEYFGASDGRVGSPLLFNNLWYVGVGALLLAVLALAASGRPDRWLWAAFALFAICVAYGIGPFLYVRWLPGTSSLLPERIGYLFIFALCLLASFGLDAWVVARTKYPGRALAAVLATAVVLLSAILVTEVFRARGTDPSLDVLHDEQITRGLIFVAASGLVLALPLAIALRAKAKRLPSISPRLARLLAPALVLITIVDLATVAPGYNAYVAPSEVVPDIASINWLLAHIGTQRVMGLGAGSQAPVLVPDVQQLYGLQSVAGYDSFHTARYEQFWASVDPGVTPPANGTPYSDVFIRPQVFTSTEAELLGVGFVASATALQPDPGLSQVYSGEMNIYANSVALPRTFFATAAKILPRDEVLAELNSPGFDVRRTVLLEKEEAPPVLQSPQDATPLEGTAQITSYSLNSVQISVDISQPAWLVLADQNYPGWTATVDGQALKVYTADYVVRAVALPAGRHHVRFSFVPSDYWLTLAISLAALVIVLFLMATDGRPIINLLDKHTIGV